MKKRIAIALTGAATLAAVGLQGQVSGNATSQGPGSAQVRGWTLEPKIAWASTRDDPTINPFLAGEIYMMNPDLTGEERITFTENAANFFPTLSPTGKRMVFDSNRLRGTGPINTSDLFLMNPDGSNETFLIRGSSATWSPDGHRIAYHASASGTGRPIRATPGSPTSDSDIFVLSVDEFLENGEAPVNLTDSPDYIDDDPDWSPDGSQIVFTRHGVNDPHNNSFTAEILVMNADGSELTQLTFNAEEERGPAWSPDGSRIAYACRKGGPGPTGVPTFEICIMEADGGGQVQLTFDNVPDFTPSWSPDGTQLVFHREVSGLEQLFRINADGTGMTQLTSSPGRNLLASQGVVKVAGKTNIAQGQPSASPDSLGQASGQAAGSVPGSYELSFLARVGNVLQLVSTLPVLSTGLILRAHVQDADGLPARSGRVAFEYCSLKGLPSNDITRPDEAPLEACETAAASWAQLLSMEVNDQGEASMNFGFVRIPRTVGFRFRYMGKRTDIASGVSQARNFTWVLE